MSSILAPFSISDLRPLPAERNCVIGNGELLAVKPALEDWCNWLQGAEQPFVVWMDHKNLAYIQMAK